tara:strand:+ start:627 stop:1289 length:663 start_codon:yes stop_codon:yes gene_type:complete
MYTIIKKETTINGLKYEPSITADDVTDSDDISMPHVHMHGYTNALNQPFSVSRGNCKVVEEVVAAIGLSNKGILEIGLNAAFDQQSITYELVSSKPPSTPYLGIDTADRRYLLNRGNNMHFLQTYSTDQEAVRKKLKEIKANSISILCIDGDHSVNTVINDFKYSDLVEEGGIIIMHDTNVHPGPVVVVDAIDTNVYKVKKHQTDHKSDWGITVAQKLKK